MVASTSSQANTRFISRTTITFFPAAESASSPTAITSAKPVDESQLSMAMGMTVQQVAGFIGWN